MTTATHNYKPRAGFDDSGASGLYHSARPNYPEAAMQAILEAAQAGKPSPPLLNILEIGSGTGISTESLLREAGETKLKILKYLAVEPSKGMRQGWDQAIRDKVLQELRQSGKLPEAAEVSCIDGSFEDLNAPKGEWDAVIIAQAWHWCPDHHRSLNAIASTLRSGGHLALIWNLENKDTSAKWVGQLRDLYEPFEDGSPQYRHGYWKTMYQEAALEEHFNIVEPKHFTRSIPTTVEGVKNRVLSKSYIGLLPQEKRDALMNDIDALFSSKSDEELGRKWIDKANGIFEYPYTTDLYLFQKK